MLDRDSKNRSGPGFSRRDFLKGSGAAVAATAVATAAREATAADERKRKNVVPAEPTEVTLNVNGKDHTVKVEPRVTLLDVLRIDLQLTGAKDVDETNEAGADTVIVDGKPVFAGAVLAHQVAGKKIRTVESLRQGNKVDPVITCFVKHDALQCGYCTPGFVMAVRAFLDKKPAADRAEIHKGLGGNICRCGTYAGISACALELAKKGGA